MKKVFLAFLAACFLIASASSCATQPFFYEEESLSTSDRDVADTQSQSENGTQAETVEETAGTGGADAILSHLTGPTVTFTREGGIDVQPYSELFFIQILEEGFHADGHLMFCEVSARLPEIAMNVPDVQLDDTSGLRITTAPEVSVQPEISFQIYSFGDDQFRFEYKADSIEDIVAYCQSKAGRDFYLYFSITSTYEGGTRRDAYFANIYFMP